MKRTMNKQPRRYVCFSMDMEECSDASVDDPHSTRDNILSGIEEKMRGRWIANASTLVISLAALSFLLGETGRTDPGCGQLCAG